MVPNVASSNLVTRPIKFNPTKTVGLNFIMASVQISNGQKPVRPEAKRRNNAGLPSGKFCKGAQSKYNLDEAIWSPDADFHRSDSKVWKSSIQSSCLKLSDEAKQYGNSVFIKILDNYIFLYYI